MKTINILGVTGSVGQSACSVILNAPEKFDVQVVTANENVNLLAQTARDLGAKMAVLVNSKNLKHLEELLEGSGIRISCGKDGLNEAVSMNVDITLSAIVGMAGLSSTVQAIKHSKVVAIANKEPLVSAGPLIIALAEKHATKLLPVDSEHNAIFQVFEDENRAQIKRLVLSASGGPFREYSLDEMKSVSVEQALAHPTWSMGRKISVDSATMMNKALEVIEAHYLFQMPGDKIDVVVHSESALHAMVEYADGSVLAQLGASDMCTPIAHALAWPSRIETPGRTLDLLKLGSLHFEAPDYERFPSLKMAYECLEAGPWACAALNAANEVAVDAFLHEQISFLDITACVKATLEQTQGQSFQTLEEIIAFDLGVRACAKTYIDIRT